LCPRNCELNTLVFFTRLATVTVESICNFTSRTFHGNKPYISIKKRRRNRQTKRKLSKLCSKPVAQLSLAILLCWGDVAPANPRTLEAGKSSPSILRVLTHCCFPFPEVGTLH